MSEYCKISDDKNIIFEKVNNDEYKLTINIVPSPDNEHTIIDIVKNKEFFNLLYELNNELIHKICTTEKEDNIQNTIIHLLINDSDDDSSILDNITDIYLYLESNINIISVNKCEIISLTDNINNINNDEQNDNTLHISLTKFNTLIEIIDDKYEIIVCFSLEKNIPAFLKTYIGFYLKKIFYKLKLYFE